MHLRAPAVAVHLGKDGGCRDGRHQRIALDNGLRRNIQHGQPVAVHQHRGRFEPQPHDGTAHGQQRGLQDVELVDLFDTGLGNAAAQGLGADLVVKLFTPRGREFLGVGQARNRVQVVQDHSRCHHGPGQGTTAGLVHASHEAGRMPGQAGLLRLRERGFSGSHRQPVGECCAAGSRAAP